MGQKIAVLGSSWDWNSPFLGEKIAVLGTGTPVLATKIPVPVRGTKTNVLGSKTTVLGTQKTVLGATGTTIPVPGTRIPVLPGLNSLFWEENDSRGKKGSWSSYRSPVLKDLAASQEGIAR